MKITGVITCTGAYPRPLRFGQWARVREMQPIMVWAPQKTFILIIKKYYYFGSKYPINTPFNFDIKITGVITCTGAYPRPLRFGQWAPSSLAPWSYTQLHLGNIWSLWRERCPRTPLIPWTRFFGHAALSTNSSPQWAPMMLFTMWDQKCSGILWSYKYYFSL